MKELKQQEELEKVVKEGGIVKFYAPWCQPCKALHTVLEEVSKEIATEIYSIDIDVVPERCSQLGVRTVPTVIAFDEGRILSRKTGQGTKQEVLDWIESL